MKGSSGLRLVESAGSLRNPLYLSSPLQLLWLFLPWFYIFSLILFIIYMHIYVSVDYFFPSME